jgi:hypothetical protein
MADLYRLSQYFLTTLSVAGGIDASQTTDIVLQAVTGIDEPTKPGIALLNYSDPLETSACEWITYTSVNTTTKELQGVARGQEDYSAKAHSNGVTVAFPLSKSHINNIVDKLEGIDDGVTLDSPTLTSPTVTSPTINGAMTLDSDAEDTITALAPSTVFMSRQAIINGNFDVWQRQASGVDFNDDTYAGPDRWNMISDGNTAWACARSASVPTKSMYSSLHVCRTANKQMGWVQILESVDSKKLFGGNVSLSFSARTTADKVVNNLRAAVIAWSSTADAVTSDVVATWAGNGTNPTLATNWTYENTPSNLALTTDFQTFKIEGIVLDTASTANIAIFIWVDDTDAAQNDEVRIAQVQLCAGDVALPFQPKSYEEELRACQRYYIQDGINVEYPVVFIGTTTTDAMGRCTFPTTMRIAPTVAVYRSNTSGSIDRFGVGAVTGCSASGITDQGFSRVTTTNSWAAGNGIRLGYTATAEL